MTKEIALFKAGEPGKIKMMRITTATGADNMKSNTNLARRICTRYKLSCPNKRFFLTNNIKQIKMTQLKAIMFYSLF